VFCCCFLFLPISVRPIISKFTGPIFVKFAGLVELLLEIINLKMVFSIPPSFLFYPPHSRVPVTFGRWRQRTVTVAVDGCRWTEGASGAAGRANAGLCPASSRAVATLMHESRRVTGDTTCNTITYNNQRCCHWTRVRQIKCVWRPDQLGELERSPRPRSRNRGRGPTSEGRGGKGRGKEREGRGRKKDGEGRNREGRGM